MAISKKIFLIILKMKFCLGLCLCLAAIFAAAIAQRGNFRQFNNNNFNNNNNFRPNNNNFRPNNNFNNNNFRPNNNFNNNNNNNFRQFNNFQPVQQRQQPVAQQQQQNNQQFSLGLDTSDGRFAKFNGPVKGLPHGHGGGRYGTF